MAIRAIRTIDFIIDGILKSPKSDYSLLQVNKMLNLLSMPELRAERGVTRRDLNVEGFIFNIAGIN